MDHKQIIAVGVAVAIAAGFFFYMEGIRQAGTAAPAGNGSNGGGQVIGGDKDEHGCLIAAGYSWCDAKQKCIRVWEENCTEAPKEVPFGAALADASNMLWGRNGVIYAATNETAVEGWFRGSLSLPGDIRISSLCAIFMKGNETLTADNKTFFVQKAADNTSGSEVCVIAVKGGVVDECNGLTLRMALSAMKAGYNKTTDNWQDFFKCVPGLATGFCQTECDTLLNGLMYQKREKIGAGQAAVIPVG